MFKRSRKIDYSKKKYSNPFFRVKRRGFVPRINAVSPGSWLGRVKLVIVIFLLVVVFIIWFFYFSSFFMINSIIVTGNTKTPSGEIEGIVRNQMTKKRFLFFKQINLNIFDEAGLIQGLNEKYYFNNLSVDKKWLHTLVISLVEKDYSLVWLENDKYYYLDISGRVLSEVQPLEIEQKNYPLIENRGETFVSEGMANISEKDINYIISLFEEFRANHNDFTIERFILDTEPDTIKVVFLDGPTIYLNTNTDMNEQINRLFVLINEKLKDNFFNKSYIDLRYGDRVYYR